MITQNKNRVITIAYHGSTEPGTVVAVVSINKNSISYIWRVIIESYER